MYRLEVPIEPKKLEKKIFCAGGEIPLVGEIVEKSWYERENENNGEG